MTDEFLNQFSTAGQRMERVGRLMSQILQETVLDSNARQRLRINLEIGCGHGHWLTNHAFQNPNEIFVGIDLISKRIEKAQAKGPQQRENVHNKEDRQRWRHQQHAAPLW